MTEDAVRYALTDRGDKLVRDLAQVESWFTYRAPTPEQVEMLAYFRGRFKGIASDLVAEVPDSRERAIALTHLRESVLLVNQAIMFSQEA